MQERRTAESDARRRGSVSLFAAVMSTIASVVGAGLWVEVNALRHDRGILTVRTLKETPMSMTNCWMSGSTRVVISTEGGVRPPLVLVPADEDPTGETPTEAAQRHRDRVAAAQQPDLWPKTGECE